MSEELNQDGSDDLFEFDELIEDEAPQAETRDLGGAVGAPVSKPAEPVEATDLRHVGLVDDFDDDPEGEHAELPPVVISRAGLPPIVVPLLLVMAAANLALVGLTWKSLSKPSESPLPVLSDVGSGPDVYRTLRGAGDGEAAPKTGFGRQVPSLASSRDDAWAILDDAQRALDADEFVPARRALFSMLTVIDRIAPAERPDLESRAGYLIAESYRLQARDLGARESVEQMEVPQ